MVDEIVRASELAEYVYCAHAWWLGRVKGIRPANREVMMRGAALHLDHGRLVNACLFWRRLGYLMLATALIGMFLLVYFNFLES